MRVLRTHLATALLPLAAFTLATPVLGAQAAGGGGVVMARSGGASTATNHRDIPAVAARALIAAHHPEVLDGSADPASVTFVLDNASNYVASAVSKAAVAVRSPDGSVAAAAGSFSSATPVITTSGGASGGTGGAGSASGHVAMATMTIAGIGPIDPSTVAEMFSTTYAAGDVGVGAVRVRFIILNAK